MATLPTTFPGMPDSPLDDHQAIVELTATYCWALDEMDFERLRDVFVPDASAQLGRTSHEGVDEIIERISSTLARFDGSQHMVSTHLIDIDGDTARCRCYLQAQHVRPDGGPLLTVGGRYEDRLVRTADGWRIAHRALVEMWRAG